MTLKPNLSEYRNTWSHWEKNVFVERLVRRLQQLLDSDEIHSHRITKSTIVKEILGDTKQ